MHLGSLLFSFRIEGQMENAEDSDIKFENISIIFEWFISNNLKKINFLLIKGRKEYLTVYGGSQQEKAISVSS